MAAAANATRLAAALADTEAIAGALPQAVVRYGLGTRALAEFVGMAMVIYTGEAALANELLPSTKGHGMGWGWAVFTFGFAFLPPLLAFQLISAKLNPAMCLAQAIWGNITWVDFVVLSLAELAGAFAGALLHFVHFYPHWRTLPEPAGAAPHEEALLRRRDVAADDALRLAGYTTRRDRMVRATNPLADLRYRITGGGGGAGGGGGKGGDDDGSGGGKRGGELTARDVLEDYFRSHDPAQRSLGASAASTPRDARPLARRTLQVADLHRHLEALHVEQALARRTCPRCHAAASDGGADDDHGDREGYEGRGDGGNGADDGGVAIDVGRGGDGKKALRLHREEARRARALYSAALVADQNLKLSIFATRPAISAPLFNLITEALGTLALILIALLIELQARRLPEALRPLYVVGLQPLLITFSIVMLIAGLGGPTTYAANPARDLGPRLAHWLLPIPNKGSSEWVYAWVPVVGPLLGGAAAGGLFIALERMSFPGGGPVGA